MAPAGKKSSSSSQHNAVGQPVRPNVRARPHHPMVFFFFFFLNTASPSSRRPTGTRRLPRDRRARRARSAAGASRGRRRVRQTRRRESRRRTTARWTSMARSRAQTVQLQLRPDQCTTCSLVSRNRRGRQGPGLVHQGRRVLEERAADRQRHARRVRGPVRARRGRIARVYPRVCGWADGTAAAQPCPWFVAFLC